MSAKTLKVLTILLSASDEKFSGTDIGRRTKLQSGTLYPILARLEEAGWLESRWEAENLKNLGRGRKHFRRITNLGVWNAKRVIENSKSLE